MDMNLRHFEMEVSNVMIQNQVQWDQIGNTNVFMSSKNDKNYAGVIYQDESKIKVQWFSPKKETWETSLPSEKSAENEFAKIVGMRMC